MEIELLDEELTLHRQQAETESVIIKKKKQTNTAVRNNLIRIIISGILFLLVYMIAEFEPSFIPLTVHDIKEALSENIFRFIR